MLSNKIEDTIKLVPKKYRQKQDRQVMFIAAYYFCGILFTHSVPTENRVNSAYYSYFMKHHLRPAERRERPNLLNSHTTVLHDNARCHIAATWLTYFSDGTGKFWSILNIPQI